MQSPDYLSQMAKLIRENPSITVREIARELQFADSKSVYYWLDKHNYHGINEFKRTVLSGQSRFTDGLAVAQNNAERFLVRVALFSWHPAEKNPVGEWCFLNDHPNPRGLFAVQVGDQSFSPWLMAGDVLILQEAIGKGHDVWILLAGEGRFQLGFRIQDGSIIDPRTGQRLPDGFQPYGLIIRLERTFQKDPKRGRG